MTLITRPRRFGKTLNLNMMNCFFSTTFSQRGDLFEGLSIWNEEEYRKMQGTWPVIFLNFAGVKANHFQGAINGIVKAIANTYEAHKYLKKSDVLSAEEKKDYDAFQNYSISSDLNKMINTQLVNLSSYGNFKKALVQGDLKYMNRFMNDVAKVMFSLFDSGNKPSETVANALRQIEEKEYDTELLDRNIPKEKIRHYGFAFQGKRVLIGENG